MNPALKPLRQFQVTLGRMVAIDLRSLAVFRIGMAVLLLADLFVRLGDLEAFTTDAGVLSRDRLRDLFAGNPWAWSLHTLSGDLWFQYLLSAVATAFAVCLLVGYRTRIATIVSWSLLVSLHHRMPLILNSGDVLFRCLLFWSMFLPLGQRWSLDARRLVQQPRRRVVSIASAAILIQLVMIYFVSAVLKNDAVWFGENSAVYYALNLDHFVKPLGRSLLAYPLLCQLLTVSTMVLELVGPPLALLPVRRGWVRTGVVAAFWSFHLGLIFTMEIGLFPWICIVAWILFLPPQFWTGLRRVLPGESIPQSAVSHDEDPQRLISRDRTSPVYRIREMICAIALGYVMIWGLFDLESPARTMARSTVAIWEAPMYLTGLHQRWGMFAPYPRRVDSWYVMRGTTKSGELVNLWKPEDPLPLDKPPVISATYPNQRWRKYFENMLKVQYEDYRPDLIRSLVARHEQTHPNQIITRAELLVFIEKTPPPGESIPAPVEHVLWVERKNTIAPSVSVAELSDR